MMATQRIGFDNVKPGDAVKLQTENIWMTVTRVRQEMGYVDVVWLDLGGRAQYGSFHPDCLLKKI